MDKIMNRLHTGLGLQELSESAVSSFGQQCHPHFLVLEQKETHDFLQTLHLSLPILNSRLLLAGQANLNLFLVSHGISLSLEDESAAAIRRRNGLEFSDNPDNSKQIMPKGRLEN